MSKSNGGGALNAIGKVITYILVVLLVLGIAGMVAFFALRGQGVTYYVEYGGERYVANGDGGSLTLETGATHTFTVKSLTGEEVNYDVTVQSNRANNFDFVVNEEYYQFFGQDDESNDYSEVFSLQKNADGFSLTLPHPFTVEQAIESKFGGDIELQNDYEIDADLCYFVITVTSGESAVSLRFSFSGLTVTLDTTHIIFGGDTAVSPPIETLPLPEQEETFIRYMVQAAQAQSYEEVQPILGTIHQLYTDFVVDGSSGNPDLRTALNAYVDFFRAVEDREYTEEEAASIQEELGDLMERYEPMR